MKLTRSALPFIFAVASLVLGAHRQEKKALTDDLSRNDLARYAVSLQPRVRALPYYFTFPEDVKNNKVYGIDVSHNNGVLKWDKVSDQRISFVYIKASQGANLYDDQFTYNWQAIGRLRTQNSAIRRGAYHFMTAADTAQDQAQNFLSRVENLDSEDMPPCLDVEWDLLMRNKEFVLDGNGKKIDQWSRLSSTEIVQRIKDWLQAVEAATGKRPIIYTNAQWWSERIGSVTGFEQFSFWMGDYSASSLGREEPFTLPSLSWTLWQLTDKGVFEDGGVAKNVDTTVYHGSPDDLLQQFKLGSTRVH